MSEFSDLFLELRTILDDPDAYYEQISAQLDPDLVDQLRAYAAAHNIPAEDAWRRLSRELGSEGEDTSAPLTVILERFLTVALDPSRQKHIEGPDLPA